MKTVSEEKCKEDELLNAIHWNKNGVTIDLFVLPGSKRNGLKGYNLWRKRIEVALKAQAEKGKANEELITLFEEYLNIKKKRINIIKGSGSRVKTIFVESEEPEVVVEYLKEAMKKALCQGAGER